jgi:lysophospholipase L1-like esterase
LDRNIGDGAVLFLGSSSVQGLHVADVAANAANLGLGGERIGELHARIAGYTSLARARLAVLAIGYNDLRAGPPEAALDAYRALLAGLPAGLKLVISGVQPGAARDALPAATDAFNTGLRALCAQRAGCAYVDLAGLVGDAYEADGVHLSAAVYSSWKQALRQAIAGLDPPPARVGR